VQEIAEHQRTIGDQESPPIARDKVYEMEQAAHQTVGQLEELFEKNPDAITDSLIADCIYIGEYWHDLAEKLEKMAKAHGNNIDLAAYMGDFTPQRRKTA
jgi:hypothetical protein